MYVWIYFQIEWDFTLGNEGSSTVLKAMKPSYFFAQVLRVALTLVVCMTLFHHVDPTEDLLLIMTGLDIHHHDTILIRPQQQTGLLLLLVEQVGIIGL
jgi:hypothetical protein